MFDYLKLTIESSSLIKKTASKIHVAIMRAFVAMRHLIQENQLIYQRLDKIEIKQIEKNGGKQAKRKYL